VKTYLVGGAVRDRLLGLEPSERDWVVVGATEQQMLDVGFRRVGHDFPVFLHPRTGEQYALARRERKSGHGHTGFSIETGVSLEDDLQRRDLTINAIAEDEDGTLIDPSGGLEDLRHGLLRHVSAAFVEDPLRVLRVARFAARFAARGFRVAPETLSLMREISAGGELSLLAPERVFAELRLALETTHPEVFIEVLRGCGALGALLPEIERLFGVPQPARHHPEIDTGVHLLLSLRMAVELGLDASERFALLLHDLGKALTDPAKWPSHVGHEQLGCTAVRELCARLRAPARWRELALLVCEHHTRCHRALEMRPATLVRMLDDIDAWRQPERFAAFLRVCEADARGRAGLQQQAYAQAERLRTAHRVGTAVTAADALARGLQGAAIGAEMHRLRCVAVAAALGEDDA